MTLSYLRNIFLLLELFAVFVRCANVDLSGEAITTRFWDCCKPSCSWNGKARFSQPVQSCAKDESPLKDFVAGTGCKGGNAYSALISNLGRLTTLSHWDSQASSSSAMSKTFGVVLVIGLISPARH